MKQGWNYYWGRILLILVAALFVAPLPTQAQSPIPDIETQSETFELEVIRLTNLERTSRGLAPLKRNTNLTNAARAHNQDMITNNFFSHTGSNGSSSSQRACAHGYTPYGWGSCYAGENIAAGYATPAGAITGWMNSAGHRANILNGNYREIGVGHATGGSWGNYWTMDLGAQPNVLPVFINNDADETGSYQVNITLTEENVSSWGSLGSITGVQISEDPDFTGAAWQPWAQTIAFDLIRGNGPKTVYVKYTDGSNEVVAADTITLNEPNPSLTINSTGITFISEAGSGQTVPAGITVEISNSGGDILHWTTSGSQSWVHSSGSSGDAPDTVNISVSNSTGILNGPAGTVESAGLTVTATNSDAVNSPQTIPVTVRIVQQIYATHLPVVVR